MTASDFSSIRYGNTVLRKADQKKFMVMLTTRNQDGTCKAAGLAPAITGDDLEQWDLVDSDFNETFLQGRTTPGQ